MIATEQFIIMAMQTNIALHVCHSIPPQGDSTVHLVKNVYTRHKVPQFVTIIKGEELKVKVVFI